MVTANGNKSIKFVQPSMGRLGGEKKQKWLGKKVETGEAWKRKKQEKKIAFNCIKFTNQKSIDTTEK